MKVRSESDGKVRSGSLDNTAYYGGSDDPGRAANPEEWIALPKTPKKRVRRHPMKISTQGFVFNNLQPLKDRFSGSSVLENLGPGCESRELLKTLQLVLTCTSR
jgi:hypothetical protein